MATPDELDDKLMEAIEAGRLDEQLARNTELAETFAAHQKLESLFELLLQPSPDTLEGEDLLGPPTQIDRFLIRRKLGQGGFGTVYLALDPKLDREVAVKVAPLHRFLSNQDADRFVQEARFNASLNHPRIVKVYDVGRDGGYVYIVLEYVPGSTLEELMDQKPWPPAKAAGLVSEIAYALDYAHQQKCYHRDLKPANILLDDQGEAHIADFGLALSGEQRNFATGQIVGTPAYMSPEQARGETVGIDGRTDIWSLGVIFYRLLTGRQPFWTGDQTASLERILTHSPQPPRQVNDDIPEKFERICLKALAKEPTERYATAREMGNDLSTIVKLVPLRPMHEMPDNLRAAIDATSFGLTERGFDWDKEGEYDKAIADYNEALRLDPNYADACNALAWLQATCPDEHNRDGQKALQSASKAFALSGGTDWRMMDTLAAAYAECGDFGSAREWQTRAIEIAEKDSSLKKRDFEEARSRLELYKQGKPYHQEPRKQPKTT